MSRCPRSAVGRPGAAGPIAPSPLPWPGSPPPSSERLRPVAGEDHLTLLTCTPYGTNSHRLLVRGVRVPYDATRDPGSRPDAGATLAPWMWWLLLPALAAIVATVLLVIVERTSRRRREVL